MTEYTAQEIELQIKLSRTIAALASAIQYHQDGDQYQVRNILKDEIKRLSETRIVVKPLYQSEYRYTEMGYEFVNQDDGTVKIERYQREVPCPHHVAGDTQ